SELQLEITIRDHVQHPIATLSTRFGAVDARGAAGSRGQLRCHVPSLTLADGSYNLDLWLLYRIATSDRIVGAIDLIVNPANYYGRGRAPLPSRHGAALMPHRWTAASVDEGQPVIGAR